jgi:hypothetical protein
VIYKWDVAKGLYLLRCHDVICLGWKFVAFQRVNDYRFQRVHRLLSGVAWRNEQLFLTDSLAVRKIHGKCSEFSRRYVGQRNDYGISVYDFAYVRRNRAQDLPQIEAGRDSGR